LELGATDDGAPSERVATVTTYFAAFIIDAGQQDRGGDVSEERRCAD
jgi:hypothetical protein